MNTTNVALNVTRPLAVTPCSLTASPRRRTILSRIGALLFAAADERHLGLGRRYRDSRFGERDTESESGSAATGGES
jgi:hypothetical protein